MRKIHELLQILLDHIDNVSAPGLCRLADQLYKQNLPAHNPISYEEKLFVSNYIGKNAPFRIKLKRFSFLILVVIITGLCI